MLKKRLIFTLLYQNKNFYLSRNFRLQKIGDIKWLKKNYNFTLLTRCIDEIILFDVSREKQNLKDFINVIKSISEDCFIPLSVGGKIKTLEDIKKRLKAGADKVVINSAAIDNPEFIKKAAREFGSQCIVVSIDVKKTSVGKWNIFKHFGKNLTDLDLNRWIETVQVLGAGEILIQSIDRDGTSRGYDLDLLKLVSKNISVPCIILGGAGSFDDFVKAHAVNNEVSLAAANIFHFTEQSVLNAKKHMFKHKINVRV